jgi:hypothetical protein
MGMPKILQPSQPQIFAACLAAKKPNITTETRRHGENQGLSQNLNTEATEKLRRTRKNEENLDLKEKQPNSRGTRRI